ncbi:MAG: tyrosine-type recombinase/integrase [Candidatus Micrarchaeaceae archaeon]
MRGSIYYQVYAVFNSIIAFGESKHQAKEHIREEFAKENTSNTWHNLGKQLKIYSYKAADQYRMVARDLLSFAKERFKLKDIEKLTSTHVNAYLQSKIAQKVKYSTFQNYAAAVEKLEAALNAYARQHGKETTYSFDLKEARFKAQSALDHTYKSRAYENPKALIDKIQDPIFKLIAQAQLEGGFRVSEINHLSVRNFLEDNTVKVEGKGGLERQVLLSEKTYNALKELSKTPSGLDGKFVFDYDKYIRALRQASQYSKQAYRGSHGLRWNFAQNTFLNLQRNGQGFEESLSKVSEALGHHRADITKHYLR